MWTANSRAHAPGIFNGSGKGDSRFSPIDDPSGTPAEVLYVGRSMTTALLETAFRELDVTGPRLVSKPLYLEPRAMTVLRLPVDITFVDLRDDALAHVGLTRSQLTATSEAHYACARQWADALLWRRWGRTMPAGLVWRSRIVELLRSQNVVLDDLLAGESAEAAMIVAGALTGLPSDPDDWGALEMYQRLDQDDGLRFAEQVATLLDATIVPI